MWYFLDILTGNPVPARPTRKLAPGIGADNSKDSSHFPPPGRAVSKWRIGAAKIHETAVYIWTFFLVSCVLDSIRSWAEAGFIGGRRLTGSASRHRFEA